MMPQPSGRCQVYAVLICLAICMPVRAVGGMDTSLAGKGAPEPMGDVRTAAPAYQLSVDTAAHDDIAMLFARKCSGCHTIGGGKLAGPDLLPAMSWALPEVRTKTKAMEKNTGPLAENELDGLSALLHDGQAKQRIEKAGVLLLASMLKSLDPPSAATGRRLYEGGVPLSSGGPLCAGCHAVNRWGGSLGPDLTLVGERMGPAALVSAIRNADYKIMRTVYKNHPVSAQEAVHLAQYFDGMKTGRVDVSGRISRYIGVAGLGGAVMFLCMLPVFTMRRHRSARAKLRFLTRQRITP